MKSGRRRRVRDLYNDLNNPIRSRDRNPLPPPPISARAPQFSQRGRTSATNTSLFRTVETGEVNVKRVIKSSRRAREEQIQSFIDEFSPPPLEVLNKIAQCSDQHRSLLGRIAGELKKYPAGATEDPLVDLGRDALSQITAIRLQIIDLENEMERCRVEEERLRRELGAAENERKRAEAKFGRYKTLIGGTTFSIFEAEENNRIIESEVRAVKPPPPPEDTAKYNALWGEGKHLREEIRKMKTLIDESRSYMLMSARGRAKAALDRPPERKIAAIDDIEDYTRKLLNLN